MISDVTSGVGLSDSLPLRKFANSTFRHTPLYMYICCSNSKHLITAYIPERLSETGTKLWSYWGGREIKGVVLLAIFKVITVEKMRFCQCLKVVGARDRMKLNLLIAYVLQMGFLEKTNLVL